jgi:WD40 repeat protein
VSVIAPRRAPPEEPVSKRLIHTLIHPDHETRIWPTFFTADGQRVVAGGYPSGGVEIWDAHTGQQLRTLRTPKGYRNTDNYLVHAPIGSRVYVPVNHVKAVPTERNGKIEYPWKVWGEIQVWDLDTGKQLGSLAESSTRGIPHAVISPDGKTLAAVECVSTGDRDPSTDGYKYCLALWDANGNRLTELYPDFCMASFSPDGHLLAASIAVEPKKHSLRIWDVQTGKVLREISDTLGKTLGRPFFSPNGDLIAAIVDNKGQDPEEVRLWETATGKEAGSFKAKERISFWSPMPFSPDGRYLAAVQRDAGRLYIFDVPSRRIAHVYDLHNRGLGWPVFSPDSQRLAIAGLEIPEDLKHERERNPFDLPQPRIFLLDLVSHSDPEIIVCPHGSIGDLVFSPNRETIALAGYGCVWLFDAGPVAAMK